jgi:hypothetical protein
MLLRMEPLIRSSEDRAMVDYMKGTHDVRHLRYGEDPRAHLKYFKGDSHFRLPHQGHRYEFDVMEKAHATPEMKYIDWSYLRSISLPIIEYVYEACVSKNLIKIMEFQCD